MIIQNTFVKPGDGKIIDCSGRVIGEVIKGVYYPK